MIDRLGMRIGSGLIRKSSLQLAFLVAAVPAMAGNISGTVSDENGEPLAAAVIVCNTDPVTAATSGFDGTYSLDLPEAGATCTATLGDARSDSVMLQAPATYEFRINSGGN